MSNLAIEDLHVSYGRVRVLRDVSLIVPSGECVGILGPNGAGKSSLLGAISGSVSFDGSITLDGRPIRGRPEEVVRLGIAHVLEGRHIFSRLSVRENMQLARFGCTDGRFHERLDWALEFFPILREKYNQPGTSLSGGQQQILAIARALLMGPKLLLLDEPSLGLAPIVIEQLAESLPRMMRDWDLTLVLAEQFLQFVTAVASQVFVLNRGRIAFSGRTSDAGFNAGILQEYLGPDDTDRD